MIKRFTTTIGVMAGLGALALGGSAIATAGTSSTSAHARPAATMTTTDTGPNVQQGDQTSPDTGTSAAETAKEASSAPEAATAENAPESAGSATDPAGGPNSGAEQQGQNEGQF